MNKHAKNAAWYATVAALVFAARMLDHLFTGWFSINAAVVTLTAVYACIGAPVTEELMYRGFVMKNLSRVGQRFGIIMSSLLFGLMHANVGQFIFAFIMGIFFAHIDVKHNSIIPSIIVHSFANTYSTVVSYSGVLENQLALALTSLATLALSIAGFALFIKFYKNN